MIRLGAGAVVGALALSGPATARVSTLGHAAAAGVPTFSRETSAGAPVLNPTGSLTFSWRGDPTLGCAAAGVCGVSGTLEVIPESQAGGVESPRQSDIMIDDTDAVARVSDPGSAAAAPRTCVDLVPVSITLHVVRSGSAGRHAVIDFAEQSPSSGRCAGPTASKLGAISLPARRLPGPREAYDMSGQARMHAGPYLVTVASTLRARRPASTPGGGVGSVIRGPPPSPRPRKRLVEQVTLNYRMQLISGALTTDFAGLPRPACLPLDACGTLGSLGDAISTADGSLQLEAERVVRHPISGAAALRDLRAGRLKIPFVAAGGQISGRLSATAAWSGGPTCRDEMRQQLNLNGKAKGTRLDLALQASNQGAVDILRTHCPGPSTDDVLGPGGSIAAGTLAVRTLGRHHLHLVLPGDGRFVGSGYEGARRGGVSIDLRLLRLLAGTRRISALPGFP